MQDLTRPRVNHDNDHFDGDGLSDNYDPFPYDDVTALDVSDTSVYVGGKLIDGGGAQGYFSALMP